MRILITGINGFVAGHMAELLLAQPGHEIVGQSRQAALALPQLQGCVQLMQADLQDAGATHALLDACRPEAIIHLAAQAAPNASFADPAATLLPNIAGQLNLFQALIALRLDPLVLVVGSADEYGIVRPEDVPVNEETPLRPANPYAVSKVAQDMLALQYFLSHRLRAVRLRPFNHIGPRQSAAFVAAAFAQQIARIEAGLQEPILRVGNLSAERDFTDVRDMVAAYALALAHALPGEVYNIGSGVGVSIDHLLQMLLAHSRVRVEVQLDPARVRPVDLPQLVCDAARFHACTGWAARIPLAQTVQDILDDWRQRVYRERL